MTINLAKYFPCETMRKAAKNRNQIVAMSLPFIIQNEADYCIVYGDRGLVYLEDNEGLRYKVVSSTGDTFNIFPSFTKGCGRSQRGCNARKQLQKERVNKVLLVNIMDDFTADLSNIAVENIPNTGIVHVCKK